MKKGVIAFDYDGVLADTFEPNIRLINRIFSSMGSGAVITKEHFNIAAEISFEAVVTAAGLEKERIAEFLDLVVETGTSIIEETFMFEGMKTVLSKLKDDYYLAVVSNNSTKIIIPGLEKEDAVTFFDAITGSDEGEPKTVRLKNLKAKYLADSENCWMIGDGINDIEAAHDAKWKSVAVTWGFQSRDILETRKPTVTLDTVNELYNVIRGVN